MQLWQNMSKESLDTVGRLDELLRQLSNPESEREQSLAESRELLRHGIALGLMMALM
ncbi:unnamed protein product, partial [Cladocopium goreaui]